MHFSPILEFLPAFDFTDFLEMCVGVGSVIVWPLSFSQIFLHSAIFLTFLDLFCLCEKEKVFFSLFDFLAAFKLFCVVFFFGSMVKI